MPKEIISSAEPDLPFLHVGWQKEIGEVQIATRESGDHLDDFDRAGLFMSLTRPDINRLIRTLRKARDDAFGRDE